MLEPDTRWGGHMEREKAMSLMREMLALMGRKQASDLFITVGFPPAMKIDGDVQPVAEHPLTQEEARALVTAVMNDRQGKEFDATQECNFAISPKGIGRFRVNAYVQQGYPAMVCRTISTEPPTVEGLGLPPVFGDVVMSERGLVMVVGATGSGKSTTLAAMIGHRNRNSRGHIVTIEDPVEFVHAHKQCIVSQREVGIDTAEWKVALKNVLRQAPNVILIGEIRDRETMETALTISETGHLALATLHANSANHAIDRVLNMFPEDRREQVLMDLSMNLRAIISQRLLRRERDEGRVPAFEILINSPLVADKIAQGEVDEIKGLMKRSREEGMTTFDQSLFDLYESRTVSYEEALRHADSVNDVRLHIKLESKRRREDVPDEDDTGGWHIVDEDESAKG